MCKSHNHVIDTGEAGSGRRREKRKGPQSKGTLRVMYLFIQKTLIYIFGRTVFKNRQMLSRLLKLLLRTGTHFFLEI